MTKLSSFYVITWDTNRKCIEYYDIMPALLAYWNEEKAREMKLWNRDHFGNQLSINDMPTTVEEFRRFIRNTAQYHWWSKCQYEVIVSSWPPGFGEDKIDVYDQVLHNLDIIVKLFKEYIDESKTSE